MATHASLAARLLRDAAKFFRILAKLERPCLCTDAATLARLKNYATANGFTAEIAKLESRTVLLDRIASMEYGDDNNWMHQPGIMLGTLKLNIRFTKAEPTGAAPSVSLE